MGLWIAQQITEQMTIRSGRSGTLVTITAARRPPQKLTADRGAVTPRLDL
jgi:hypothetical protein